MIVAHEKGDQGTSGGHTTGLEPLSANTSGHLRGAGKEESLDETDSCRCSG